MSEELKRIIESKREYRIRLASLPIAEKLRMLEALRERTLAIRGPKVPSHSASILWERFRSKTGSAS